MKIKGGWSTDSCSIANTSAEETTCQCTMLGTYAIISKIRQPFVSIDNLQGEKKAQNGRKNLFIEIK